MLRSFVNRFCGRAPSSGLYHHHQLYVAQSRSALSSVADGTGSGGADEKDDTVTELSSEKLTEMAFFHHKKRPRFKDYVKFKSPRKRASKLLLDLSRESVEKSKAAKPAVFGVDYAVGDAIECEIIEQGGVGSTELKKVRGVVIGKFNKGMDSSVLIRDVVMGMNIERLLPLHSPLVKTIRLLEKNFVYKGKRKVKRAKLYFLRERNPNEYKVTKGKS